MQALDAKLNRNPHAVDAGLVFCSIIRCREMKFEDIAKFIFIW
jgi:hypothetical protein